MTEASTMDRVGGVVLCGGRSLRMGADKAWLCVDGEPLLRRVVRVVGTVAAPVVVVAAAGQTLPELDAEVEIVRDEHADQGPMEGLRMGLARLKALSAGGREECRAAFVVGCDYPFLSAALARHLLARLGNAPDTEGVVARTEGRVHPLVAVYATAVLAKVEALLAEGRRGLGALVERCRCAVVDEDELAAVAGGLESYINVNTPEEYEAAKARLAGR